MAPDGWGPIRTEAVHLSPSALTVLQEKQLSDSSLTRHGKVEVIPLAVPLTGNSLPLIFSPLADLVEAGQAMVSAGAAASLSGWVNDALRRQVEHDRRLRGIDEFIRAFEAEHGEITEVGMNEVARNVRARAVVVRGGSI